MRSGGQSPNGFYDQSSSNVTGGLKNNCGRTFRSVPVRFKIFDPEHNQVGVASGDVTHLKPGETSQFMAHGFVSGKTFELDLVTRL
jgi:hypothetical protein